MESVIHPLSLPNTHRRVYMSVDDSSVLSLADMVYISKIANSKVLS
jgi:hypothetical protein